MSRPVDALIDFLRTEEARGITHVHLDEDSRQVLRDLNARSRKSVPAARVTAERPIIPIDTAPAPKAAAVMTELRIEGITAAEQIDSLRRQAETWAPALSLGTLKTTMVFSVGNPEAEIMLVGEAPGYQEERQKEPFVGPAGQKLTDILKAMGLDREQVYISNIVKFRPAMAGQTTNNRPPSDDELASCLPFIRAEVAVVKPRCIIALGGSAAKGLLNRDDAVAKLRGSWHEFAGVPVRVTYHPSYLLRGTSGNDDKRKVWEDMLAVMELLAMRISEKQRGFFSK